MDIMLVVRFHTLYSGYDPSLSDIKAALVIEVTENLAPPILPSYNFPSQNTIIEEEKRGLTRTFRTKYVPINNVGDLMVQVNSNGGYFFYKQFHDLIVNSYVKVVATLSDGKGHQGVFVTKIKTKNAPFVSAPTSLQNIPEDRTLIGAYFSNVGEWNSVTIAQPTSFNSPGISVSAGNFVVLTPGTALTNGASIKAGTPNGNPTVITQGDPSSICVSSTYVTKSTQFARLATEPDEAEKVFQLHEKETTAFPNPTTGKVSFRYYIEELT